MGKIHPRPEGVEYPYIDASGGAAADEVLLEGFHFRIDPAIYARRLKKLVVIFASGVRRGGSACRTRPPTRQTKRPDPASATRGQNKRPVEVANGINRPSNCLLYTHNAGAVNYELVASQQPPH